MRISHSSAQPDQDIEMSMQPKQNRLFSTVDLALDVVVGSAVVLELVILFANVLSRSLLDDSILWANEFGHLILSIIAFVGGALAYNRNEHIAVHAVIDRLADRTRTMVLACMDWVVMIGSLYIAWISVAVVKSRGDELSTVMEISMRWFVLPLTVGMVLMAFFAVGRLLQHDRRERLQAGIITAAVIGTLIGFNALWGPFEGSALLPWLVITVLGLLLALGLPVGFVLAAVAILYIHLSGSGRMIAVPSTMQSGVSNFVLLAIPFFMMAGYVMTEGGLSRRLSDFVVALVGRVRGGLYQVVIVSMYIFSGISGSKAADVAAVGTALQPMIRENEYDEPEFAALLSAGAVMGETIPPSLPMLVLGSITTISMGALFLAGVVPAVVLALCLMVAIYVRARLADRYPGIRTPFPVLMRATLYAAPALLVPLMLVIGIATGFATPTEISSVAVVYGLALSVLLYRELTWYKLWRSISDTGVKAGMILFITATASTFAYTLTSAGIPTRIAELMIEIAGRSSWVFMLASLLVLVVMGALLEGLPALLVFAPILMPLAPKFGVSPIQYGIVLLIAMGLGCFAPIIGVGMYISCSVTGTKVEPASRAMVPYAVILFLGLLLVAFVPWFSLVLPRLFGFI